MPDFDGNKVAEAIKAISPTTPIIMMTGWGALMKAAGEKAPGIDALVSKPPRIAELNKLLLQLTLPAGTEVSLPKTCPGLGPTLSTANYPLPTLYGFIVTRHSALLRCLTPFPATHPKKALKSRFWPPVSPFPATHTKTPYRKSFRCHTYGKQGESPGYVILALLRKLASDLTIHCPLPTTHFPP